MSSLDFLEEAYSTTDENRYKCIIGTLRMRRSATEFHLAMDFCASDDSLKRQIGADILGWQGEGFREKSFQKLLPLLDDEEVNVIASAATSLGNSGDETVIPKLVQLKNHPSDKVREGVVWGLRGRHQPEAVDALIELTNDNIVSIRKYSTFILSSEINLNNRAIRAALVNKLEDSFTEIRAEAFIGLAKRGCLAFSENAKKELDFILESGTAELFPKKNVEVSVFVPSIEEIFNLATDYDNFWTKFLEISFACNRYESNLEHDL